MRTMMMRRMRRKMKIIMLMRMTMSSMRKK